MFRKYACTLLMVVASVIPAGAADAVATTGMPAVVAASTNPPLATDVDWSLAPTRMGDSRGALLPVLYVGLGGLNAFDAFTTTRGLAAGRAVEGNPIVGGFAGKPAAMWAVKGGATFASVFIAERLWRRQHRAQAIAVMLVSNGMMAAVAMRNSSVLSR